MIEGFDCALLGVIGVFLSVYGFKRSAKEFDEYWVLIGFIGCVLIFYAGVKL